MAQNYQRGDLLPVQWFPSGFGTNIIVPITGYDVKFESLLIDVTTTGTAGLRARLAGLKDFDINVTSIFDFDSPYYRGDVPISDGLSGILAVSVNTAGTRFFQLPAIIGTVHDVSKLEDALRYDFNLKANARAGIVVFPNFP